MKKQKKKTRSMYDGPAIPAPGFDSIQQIERASATVPEHEEALKSKTE
jgi:hypothetical protein